MNEFTDGLVYITYEQFGEEFCICKHVCEYDEPITLDDIKKQYPTAKLVLYNEARKGWLFKLVDGDWVQTGTTQGYA